MNRQIVIWVTILLLQTGALGAQEICNNGRDDDNDGFIDCYDPDCSVSTFCKGFYLGDDALCEATPPAFPQFTMALDFSSPNETTNHLSRMAVGDLNRDGMPEIITMNRYTDKVFILNGKDGSVAREATVPFDPNWEIAIANIDNDNCGEIFFFGTYDPPGNNNTGSYLFAYDCDLNFLWRTKERLRGDPINYGLADFDGDGRVELYVKDEIFDAHTGTRLVKSTGASWTRINGGPVAVDMEGDDDLELVLGCAIYDVDLRSRTQDAGTLTLLKSAPAYFIRNEYNATSVADYNLDGHLDVLASGSTQRHGNNTTVFFWDVHNNSVLTYSDPIPGNITIYACPDQNGPYYKDGWKNGTGRINIGDLDGDGKLNASYVSGKYLYALDENFQPLPWSPKLVNEETSGHTGCTLFDFNGDGKSEIVYRDERFLYIINGTDGSIYNQQACVSRTNREYPIVADVDADGSTELCVTCGFDDAASVNNFCNLNYSRYSHIRVFKSGGDPWVPARRVWNQHGYFNVNVNDDLTIPVRQQRHHLVFSTGSCTEGPNRPLNTFLNQTPFLNRDGCPTYRSPDVTYVENSLTVTPPQCPDDAFRISFQIANQGDIGLSGNVPVSLYDGHPLQEGAVKLGTVLVPLDRFDVGDVHTVTDLPVHGPGSAFTLYVVLNDAGTSLPSPVTLPNTSFLECDYADNIVAVPVNPVPVNISVVKIQDNIKCAGSTSPDNGAVRAYVPAAGGGENTSEYDFYWSAGTSPKPLPADHTGAVFSGIPEGTYTVYAVHKTAGCASASAQVTVERAERPLSVSIALLHPDDHCTIPAGSLQAIVNDPDGNGEGDPPQHYHYGWFEENDDFTEPTVGISHIAAGLKAQTYTVIVTDPVTGCKGTNSRAVPDQTVRTVVTATAADADCSDPSSGALSASVNGVTHGFTFDWSAGKIPKPLADFQGSSIANVTTGSYTVVAKALATGCSSDPVTVSVNSTPKPAIAASVLTPMTSCDASLPDGKAFVSVSGPNDGAYTVEWFRGQNTLPENRIASNPEATGLSRGVYTVKVTNTGTGCHATDEVTVALQRQAPVVSVASVNDVTVCTTPDGRITVSTAPASPENYAFKWYRGPSVKASPDFPEDGNSIAGLAAGYYTVQAVHKTTRCVSAPLTVSVADKTPATRISLNTAVTVIPSDCTSPDGTLQVSVAAPGNVAGFKVEWFFGGPPHSSPPVRSDAATRVSTATGLKPGLYTVVATNLDNGCQHSEMFDLPFADAHSLKFAARTNVTQCAPGNTGQISVDLVPTPLAGFDEGDYEIHLHAGPDDTGVPIEVIQGIPGTARYVTGSNLSPGLYTLVAISRNILTAGCRSVPLRVEIEHQVSYPGISAAISANTNCPGAAANGAVHLNIDGPSPESDYTYSWFEGSSVDDPPLGTSGGITIGAGETVTNLTAGTYTVRVTDAMGASRGCTSVATFVVEENLPSIAVPAANLSVTDISACDDPNGSAAVTAVTEDGAQGSLADYSFTWLDARGQVLPDPAAPNTAPSIASLAAGTYFVVATKTGGASGAGCASTMVEFAIADNTKGTVSVNLAGFASPTRCRQPQNSTGELVVEASGTSTAGYSYAWHNGSDTVSPVLSGEPSLTGIVVPDGETSATFTVVARNNSNHCTATETFTLPLEISRVLISASAVPVTYCANDNGSVFARVTSGGATNYSYMWFSGTVPGTSADFSGGQVDGLSANSYTVVAVDPMDSFCRAQPVTVTVEDALVIPVLSAEVLEPQTTCGPARANGAARALVSGDPSRFRVEWHEGPGPSGLPQFTGPQVSTLRSAEYTVVATDRVTGCSSQAVLTIPVRSVPVERPDARVLSHVTSCIAPNGMLQASVLGNTSDYVFHWYDRDPGAAPDTARAAFVSEIRPGLKAGTYYVSATSRLTGCVSSPAHASVDDAKVFPDFGFKTSPATCGGDDGHLSIFMLNDADITTVIWESDGGQTTGPILQNIPAGTYSVTVTSAAGCVTSREVPVGTEIRPFNGISRNGDGRNEAFHINCIDAFPANLVKIFNRAGTLVYEAEGYNNIDVYFDGRANRGITIIGSNLPDGTYFYVIDKRDGSKPLAGYLEIVN